MQQQGSQVFPPHMIVQVETCMSPERSIVPYSLDSIRINQPELYAQPIPSMKSAMVRVYGMLKSVQLSNAHFMPNVQHECRLPGQR